MKYLVFTMDGYGLPVAWRLAQEGNPVEVALVHDQSSTVLASEGASALEGDAQRARRLALYDGMLEKCRAEDLVEEMLADSPKDTFAFFDLNHLFRFSERLSLDGLHGNFPTESDLCYEIDRDLAKDFVAEHYPEVRVGKKHRFDRVEDGERFLRETQGTWVLKGMLENAVTVVPEVNDDALGRQELLAALINRREDYESGGFILERLVHDALELTPERIYYDGKLVAQLMCIENKPIGAGNLGPMTDCAQDLVFSIGLDDPIGKIAFPPIVDEMAANHKGMFVWDASLLLDASSGDLYFSEFCANRVGYNSFYSELTLAGGPTRFFEMIVRGEDPFPKNEVAASVRMFNPHVGEDSLPKEGLPIAWLPEAEGALWPVDIRRDGELCLTSGYTDSVCVVTGKGTSLSAAASAAYQAASGIAFEGGLYRPQFDFLSREYPTSIVNRLRAGLERGLFTTGFEVDV